MEITKHENTKMSDTENKKSEDVILINVRLSFPDLHTAKVVAGGKPRYGCAFLIPKDDKKNISKIEAEITRLTDEKFGGKKRPDKDQPFHDGDDKDYDGYAGHYYLSANRAESQRRPQVLARDKSTLAPEDADYPYAGCYVNAVVRFYTINGKGDKPAPAEYGKKIACALEIVQFVKDGEPFGASQANADALPDLAEDDDYEV